MSALLLQLTWLFSLVLFRADDLRAVGSFLSGLVRLHGWFPAGLGWCFPALLLTLAFQAVEYRVNYRPLARVLCFFRAQPIGIALVFGALVVALVFKIHVDLQRLALPGASGIGNAGFIYFKF